MVYYTCRFGAAAVHSLISKQPQLLSSKPQGLLAKKQLLQQLLGLDHTEVLRVIVKAPR
jgi:hypothetical protein